MMARVDPRLAFLACASARLTLVEEGVLTLDEALDDAFIERFRAVAESLAVANARRLSSGTGSIPTIDLDHIGGQPHDIEN
jgi:hypothetical protein